MVFRTFSEIDQKVIIDQAADRQKFIDQAQSLNLMVDPTMPIKELNALYLYAWEKRWKLYYQHSTNAAQQFGRKKLLELSTKNNNAKSEKIEVGQNANVCVSCEG
ncbi:MAG: hypothetical protein R3B65_01205 [Candidatus Paceibacterota bacterium]